MSRFSYDVVEPKTDCFAYKERGIETRHRVECSCLTDVYCKTELCAFYKTREQLLGGEK